MAKKKEFENPSKGKPSVANSFQKLSELFDKISAEEGDASEQGEERRKPNTEFRNATYNIVSLMAYLIGVDKDRFGENDAPYLLDIYTKANKDKSARIIRNLSMLRTAFEKNYISIVGEFRTGLKNIGRL